MRSQIGKLEIRLIVALFGALFTGGSTVQAAVVAHDNFESYAEGSTIIGGTGGTGWTSAWAGNTPATLPVTLATSGIISGMGRSLEIGTPGGDHRNIAQREFAPQTADVYVGFTLQTGDWDGDFFQIYANADNTLFETATGSNINSSFSAGLLNDPGMNRYFARKGNATAGVGTTVNSSISHTANTAHTFVVKFSKNAPGAANPYDETTLWIDPATEGTPTAFVDAASLGYSSGTTPALAETISVLHFRMNVEAEDRVYLDKLTVATTFADALNGPSAAVPGDFDSDSDVDGADFVVWQTNFPTATGAMLDDGDADGDGDVDGADFVVWQTNFPTTPSPGVAPIPEPGAAWLFILGGAFLTSRIGWKRLARSH